ncbi:AAA family ATPase [Methylacidiphilum caldifontis]|uniref:ATP-dependent protease n=1 Tax=Methylacidiphilum caldifontis TaxID=2795386 RepID=A0A4Y8PFV7_9BACT|nr:AAA family ATPase [Methylacidiphilum caldifontis]TFE70747.1 ATP-dependent protease [Methylacidiphilum caldifontis]
MQKRLQDFVKSFGNPSPQVSETAKEDQKERFKEKILQFQFTPKDIKAYLDRFVIKQEEAKKVLSVAVCDHYNQVKEALMGRGPTHYVKQNVLLVGPSGVGKTYLIRCLADCIGVPMVKADATKFSETGYVGADVEDLVRELIQQAEGDIEIAQYGIIYLDEVDKLASSHFMGRDVSGRGVQSNLLKLLEETDVPIKAAHDVLGQMQSLFDFQRGSKAPRKTINTRYILFILSGAFEKLSEIVQRRIRRSHLGFQPHGPEGVPSDIIAEAQTVDFVEYGLEPEFIGRLPVRVFCQPLGKEDLFHVLRDSEGSILKQYKSSFAAYGIELKFTEEALHLIAEKAIEEKTGARGLMTICEKVLRPFRFELPGSCVRELEIDSFTVLDPEKRLGEILQKIEENKKNKENEQIEQFLLEFYKANEIRIHFHPDAIEALKQEAHEKGISVIDLCKEKFKNYSLGLKLIKKNNGTNDFILTKEDIQYLEETLNRWIATSYKSESPSQGQ